MMAETRRQRKVRKSHEKSRLAAFNYFREEVDAAISDFATSGIDSFSIQRMGGIIRSWLGAGYHILVADHDGSLLYLTTHAPFDVQIPWTAARRRAKAKVAADAVIRQWMQHLVQAAAHCGRGDLAMVIQARLAQREAVNGD